MWQATHVQQKLEQSGYTTEIIGITSTGDKSLGGDLATSVGQFIHAVDTQLQVGNIDIAVHSLKDMESAEDSKLIIGAYIKRNDYRDVIISNKIKSLEDLKGKIVIGSSSKRRELQLKKINKNISITSMRGNIDTRIKKLDEGKLDGVILAAAGVKSLNLDDKIGLSFKSEEVLPAVGQGIIAVQCNKNDDEVKNLLRNINDTETEICAKSERAMLQAIKGDCETAVGGLAIIENNNLKFTAQLFSDSGLKSYEYELMGKTSEAVNIGKSVGEELLKLAGSEFKKK